MKNIYHSFFKQMKMSKKAMIAYPLNQHLLQATSRPDNFETFHPKYCRSNVFFKSIVSHVRLIGHLVMNFLEQQRQFMDRPFVL